MHRTCKFDSERYARAHEICKIHLGLERENFHISKLLHNSMNESAKIVWSIYEHVWAVSHNSTSEAFIKNNIIIIINRFIFT